MITKTIAEIFRNIAKILELKGENVFRIRAYERAAQNIESSSEDIQGLINENRLKAIPGIGSDLSGKIMEIAKTGKLKFYEELRKTIPEGLMDLLNIPSVGPKHARLFHQKLKIKSIAGLEKAARQGKLLELEGIKEKTVENILKGIALLEKGRERMDLATAILTADEFITPLKSLSYVKKIAACGSLRRMKETIRDIDILVVSDYADKVMDTFVKLPAVKDITLKGATKSSIITKEGAQVDLRVVEEKSYGSALIYFTGSKNFNIKIRRLAIKKDLKINEYGVFKLKNNKETYLLGKTEEEIFKCLGLSFIEPELREDRGEAELAAQDQLPELVSLKDIRGDFHSHSKYSDGQQGILEMADAARQSGYTYLNISDHSQGLKVAGGLSIEELKTKKAEVDKLNSKMRNFRILFGTEVDIDANGGLDYPDAVLAEFDVVVAAIHSGFKQSRAQSTRRLVSACKNKNVDIIGHPTGRLWGTRDGYEINFEQLFKAASDYGTALEINAYPLRLDLNDTNARQAKEKGVKLAISTDAHSANQLRYMRLGVATARRGWLTKDDVLNTLSCEELMKLFKK
ncbi:MAG: hypothetical protein A3H41_01980 [Omnitrophica WOR_2 bacterium RIFCSPLOWO2_02_FULL_45_28]|nr:MAG: hypothetical protein A3H41_01980 [Omnitrophica WOR_2 bacterium RIFCSPLOWO2_02_FULL_45_28]